MQNLIRELKVSYKTKKRGRELTLISSPQSVWELAISVIENQTQENFLILALNNKTRVSGYFTVSLGTVSEALIHPRDVFKSAILCNSSSIILVHNHPSGDCTPSREDIEITKRLVRAGKLLGIEVIDHVIVSDEGFSSMKEEYLM